MADESGMSLLTMVLLALAGLSIHAFFAGYETGIISINPTRLRRLVREGSRRARILESFVERPERALILTLISTNIGVVLATIVLATRLGELWAILILTPVTLVFCEIIPKTLFRQHASRLSVSLSYVLWVWYIVLYPLIGGASRFFRFVIHVAGMKSVRGPYVGIEEMRWLFVEGEEAGEIDSSEREMIHGVIDLGATTAKEVMVPRIDMVAIEAGSTRDELAALFEQSGYTRIPVYDEQLDDIRGIVSVHDLIGAGVEDGTSGFDHLVKPTYYVPDTKCIDALLPEMRDNRIHMAIVVDEYGGTDGLLTLEDLVEEIFGEIQDEYDSEKPDLQQMEPGQYMVQARMTIKDVNDKLGLALPEEDSDTIGGLVLQLTGKIPVQGEQVRYKNLVIDVVEANEHSVSQLRLKIEEEKEEDTNVR
jgi:CBS domain containing-hemolysin-like protein